jgi:NAD(P)-dependent dehydrogenase (short-subunit alcohol dehydrogenase family)
LCFEKQFKDMNRKIILVTGSNKGIGFEVARQLLKLGHRVILACRDESKGIAAVNQLRKENLDPYLLALDIANAEKILQGSEKITKDFGSLDVLVNNAAILLNEDRSLLKNTDEVMKKTLDTNVHAQLNVTKKFLSLIPNGGRIIMTSSQGGSMSDPVGGWSPAYCVSKSMLNAMTRHLAHELASRGIAVNAYDPGWVRTDMGGKSAPRSVEQGADTAVWLATAEKISTGKFFSNRKEIPW